MKFAAMFSDVASSLFKRPVTQKYPFEKKPVPERLRGAIHWNPETCTGCGLCAKDCPAFALDVIVLDKKERRIVMRYDVDRCTFCGQCVASCNKDSLSMSSEEWELAGFDREGFVIYYGDEANITEALEDKDQQE